VLHYRVERGTYKVQSKLIFFTTGFPVFCKQTSRLAAIKLIDIMAHNVPAVMMSLARQLESRNVQTEGPQNAQTRDVMEADPPLARFSGRAKKCKQSCYVKYFMPFL
jgi:hypothetical protein